MKRSFFFTGLLAVVAVAGACSSPDTTSDAPRVSGTAGSTPAGAAGSNGTSVAGSASDPPLVPAGATFAPTAEQTLNYMRYLGPALLGRVLTDEEEQRINAEAAEAVKPLVTAWVQEEAFAEAVRNMMEVRLGTNGVRGETDFNLAGYIVRHVVKHARPWGEILTSTTCYDAADQPKACDTGAPYAAGVLTTRGFLAGNESRFNLSRARGVLLTFMCRDYPHETELQPPIDKSRLKVMFRASSPEEQQVAEAAGGFGNGLACYGCHSQFSNHAQPFVKFDNAGMYVPEATGVQSKTGQLGESDHETMASHFLNDAEAGLEKAQWFGEPIDNLAEGAAVIAKHPKFHECAVQQLLDLGLGLDAGFDTGQKGMTVTGWFLAEVANSVTAVTPTPTIQQLAIATYSDVRVIAATVDGLKR